MPKSSPDLVMIRVVADELNLHQQTIRYYETRGLVRPQRSVGGTRLFSRDDITRLRRIQELTSLFASSIVAVEYVLALEEELARSHSRQENPPAASPIEFRHKS
jgi:MerR family transcriptional regulator/heat shock protein HspR